jgi:CDP-diacylglycerol--glycerol-3-phosphate 3-phosphatidyltransferase
MSLKWLPNALTIARCVFAVCVIIGFWNAEAALTTLADDASNSLDAAARQQLWYQFSLLAFISGALTDYLDGWLARKLDAHSRFGVWLDPIADKLLIGAALLGLALTLKTWLIYLPAAAIIARDIFITWFRTTPKGASAVSPSNLAKWKTAFEMVAIIGLMLPFALWPATPGTTGAGGDGIWMIASYAIVALLWVAAVLSLATGYAYVSSAHPPAER